MAMPTPPTERSSWVGSAVVADRLGAEDADVAGGGEEVVAVLERVEPPGGDRDMAEVVEGVEDVAGCPG
jgi:hypothetical protein